jgi:lipopolysaccharide export system permease protein
MNLGLISMKILHRHILSTHFLFLCMTLIVFTFILLSGSLFKELESLPGNQIVNSGTMIHLFILLMPYILSLSMPMALLAATLMVMGRISADNELTACRACGISFLEVIFPILAIAAILCFFCLYVNCSLAPKARYVFKETIRNTLMDIAIKRPIILLEEGKPTRISEEIVLFIGKKDIKQNTLQDVRVVLKENNKVTQTIFAKTGVISSDINNLKIKILLLNGRIDPEDFRNYGSTFNEHPFDWPISEWLGEQLIKKTSLEDYTFSELWRRRKELKFSVENSDSIILEMNKRVSLSLACVAFVLVGLPLGVQVQRRESSIGLLVSLILTFSYYFMTLFAQGFGSKPHLHPELIIWIPNLIFATTGLYLLLKQNRM